MCASLLALCMERRNGGLRPRVAPYYHSCAGAHARIFGAGQLHLNGALGVLLGARQRCGSPLAGIGALRGPQNWFASG